MEVDRLAEDVTRLLDEPARVASRGRSRAREADTGHTTLIASGVDGPYHQRLAAAIARQGRRVITERVEGRLSLLCAVRRHHPVDVVHLHWTHGLIVGASRWRTVLKGLSFVGELAMLKACGIRLVWTAHTVVDREQRHPWLEELFTRLAARLYDRVIVHCHAAGDAVAAKLRLRGRRRARIATVPPGHFIDRYPYDISRDEARRRLRLPADGPVFLHFGEIRPCKGVFDLIRSFDRVASPTARLVVAGAPWSESMIADLRQRAREDRRLSLYLEFVPDEEVQTFFRGADAVILPNGELMPSGSAMLAMSFGRAVIAPRCGCSEEMLGSQGGLLYDAVAPGGLARALDAACHCDLGDIGAANRERAASWDWDTIAARTVALYARSTARRA